VDIINRSRSPHYTVACHGGVEGLAITGLASSARPHAPLTRNKPQLRPNWNNFGIMID